LNVGREPRRSHTMAISRLRIDARYRTRIATSSRLGWLLFVHACSYLLIVASHGQAHESELHKVEAIHYPASTILGPRRRLLEDASSRWVRSFDWWRQP